MNVLHVIDVSALVYTGATSRFFADRSYYGFCVGGINFIMRQITNCFLVNDPVILCFDSPSFRKQLLPSYKSGRVHRPDVYSQIEFLHWGLSSCGFRCEKFDGYEADDIVDWAVQKWHEIYQEIVIVGNDHDLCHSVRSGVRFKSVRPDAACIFPGNFEENVDKTYTKFNTISAKKTLCGCNSDKIKPFSAKNGMSANQLYQEFLHYFERMNFPFSYEVTSDRRYFLAFVNDSGLFTDDERFELVKRSKLVYPTSCPEGVTLTPVTAGSFNYEQFCKFLTMTNDTDSLRCIRGKRVMLSEDDKQLLRDRAKHLTSGEFAADNNLEFERPVGVSTLSLSGFTKEF